MVSNMNGAVYASKQALQIQSGFIDQVFQKYEEAGFLYPAKKELLDPHFSQITENWKSLFTSEEQLLWIVSATEQKKNPKFASISIWKSGNFGVFAQHLVSTGNPYLSLQVMLEAQAQAAAKKQGDQIQASQNWFRPNNRYAFRVFASMYDKLGDKKATLIRHQYLHLPLDKIIKSTSVDYRMESVTGVDWELIQFVSKQYGDVFVCGEELDRKDIEFRQAGRIYRKYGLQISRKVFKVREQKTGKIIACLIANRAPLGLNFSFLENRAYYILDRSLDAKRRKSVLSCMNTAIRTTYKSIPIGLVPIVTDSKSAKVLAVQGAIKVREYMQSIWLREGFQEWYDHIASFLKKIERKHYQ